MRNYFFAKFIKDARSYILQFFIRIGKNSPESIIWTYFIGQIVLVLSYQFRFFGQGESLKKIPEKIDAFQGLYKSCGRLYF